MNQDHYKHAGGGPDCDQGGVRTAAALVTAMHGDTRWLLLAERRDGGGWEVPGTPVDDGESSVEAAIRGLAEEAGRGIIDTDVCRPLQPGYLPGAEQGGAVTEPVEIDLGLVECLPAVAGRGRAVRAEWIHADSYPGLVRFLKVVYDGEVYAAHAALLAGFVPRARAGRQAPELTAHQGNGG